MRRRYEDKENIPIRQESMPLKVKQQPYSTIPPLKIQNYEGVDNLSRFRKRDFMEDEPYSPKIIYGISKVSWRPNSPNYEVAESTPSILEISRLLEQIGQQIQLLPVDCDMTKVRLMHRLLILIERILSPDRLDDDVLIIGRKEEANSIQLLGDVYQFYIQEKQKEISMLKTRLETKQTETLNLQRKIMSIMVGMDKLKWEVEGARRTDDTIVRMHTQGSQSSLKLEQFSQCIKEPFIKVCSQYTKEVELASLDIRWIKAQNIHELFGNESAIEQQSLVQCQQKLTMDWQHPTTTTQAGSNTLKMLKDIITKEEKECQTVDHLTQQEEYGEYVLPTLRESIEGQPQGIEPICHTFRSSIPQNSKLTVVSTLYSLSLEHKTKDVMGLVDFKNLLKQLTDIVNMTWAMILKLRQVNKSAGDRRCQRQDLHTTKELIESFEKWFNDQYGYYSRQGGQPPSQFYQQSTDKIEDFVKAMSLLVSSVV